MSAPLDVVTTSQCCPSQEAALKALATVRICPQLTWAIDMVHDDRNLALALVEFLVLRGIFAAICAVRFGVV
jgi:hypothetical protein